MRFTALKYLQLKDCISISGELLSLSSASLVNVSLESLPQHKAPVVQALCSVISVAYDIMLTSKDHIYTHLCTKTKGLLDNYFILMITCKIPMLVH